jgi:hypothetical protein
MLTLDGCEDYRSFVDKLAETNVDNYIDLPMIAVMGDTSRGKSYLLSAISMNELPSSDELTTRYPIMLRMSRSDKRTATVEVIWKDTPKGNLEKKLLSPQRWFASQTGMSSRSELLPPRSTLSSGLGKKWRVMW